MCNRNAAWYDIGRWSNFRIPFNKWQGKTGELSIIERYCYLFDYSVMSYPGYWFHWFQFVVKLCIYVHFFWSYVSTELLGFTSVLLLCVFIAMLQACISVLRVHYLIDSMKQLQFLLHSTFPCFEDIWIQLYIWPDITEPQVDLGALKWYRFNREFFTVETNVHLKGPSTESVLYQIEICAKHIQGVRYSFQAYCQLIPAGNDRLDTTRLSGNVRTSSLALFPSISIVPLLVSKTLGLKTPEILHTIRTKYWITLFL